MRAVVARADRVVVEEVDDPVPGSGHVLARPIAAGICGSDLHAAGDLAHFATMMDRVGAPALDASRGAVLGHEFCAEIVDHGPDTARTLPVGTRVCSVPVLVGAQGVEQIGYSSRVPGALAEQLVLQESFAVPVPDGLASDVAALTEPMAVGEHAVGIADPQPGQPCMVVGCGPVGLAVIAALKARGIGPVLAVDLAPGRRRLAAAFGADEVLDPDEGSPHDRWPSLGVPGSVVERAGAVLLGAEVADPVVFEAVGTPGVLASLVEAVPPRSRVVVVGVCMRPDEFEPFLAVVKELELRFSFAYTPAEFAVTLERLASGVPGVTELVTDRVELAAAPAAFSALATPGEHGKILVRP